MKNLLPIAALLLSAGVAAESLAGPIVGQGLPGYCLMVWKDTQSPPPIVLTDTERRVDKDIRDNPADFGAMYCKANLLIDRSNWQEVLALSPRMMNSASGLFEKMVAHQLLWITHDHLGSTAESERYKAIVGKLSREMIDRRARGDVFVNVNENRH